MDNRIPINLKEFISKNQSISIDQYINFCLFNKENGYYQKSNSVGSDFSTSPEISQIFGECIAFLFLYLRKINQSESTQKIVELGPGNATLVLDIINIINKKEKLKDWNFLMVEKSANLRNRQKNKLLNLQKEGLRVSWNKNLQIKDEKRSIYFLCNEFFDALPINQFLYLNEKWIERKIALNTEGMLHFTFEETLKRIPQYYKKCANGSFIEHSNSSKKILDQIFSHISNFGGVFLLIDYGPYKKKRIDTLQAIYKKKKCNVLDYPCFSDITHHIDFEYIINLSKKFGLKYYGPVSQKTFLLKLGAFQRLKILIENSKNKKQQKDLLLGYKRVTDIEQMGELFKCLIFTNKNYKLPINFE